MPNNRYYHYEVYASKDKENWIKVAQKNTNEIQNQNGETFDLNISARYLKIVGKYNSMIEITKDNDSFHIVEWKVYGKPVKKLDYTALNEAIAKAEALNENAYTSQSWKILMDALATAKEILANEEATQADVDATKDALLIAIDALLPNTHKEALEIALELANKITEHDLENVVPAVVEEFIAARAEADEVYNDAKASQEQINKAFDRLAKAMHMLDFIKGDKTALKAFIDKVEGLKDSKDQYTQASWDALEEVLAKAVGVYDNPNAMQEEVNNAYKELVTAFLNLRLIPDKSLLEELINKAE
ncbi:MAG: discoidin domain-containing protein, partial [Thomasclavelia spiroformis]|uniref:discoidin domain-containing protein n=1 Tax=Thomasclavelia spiroformis TaxID=29348 RepID=UPI0039A35DAD